MEGLELIPNFNGRGPVQRSMIRCRDVVISAGCWTPSIFETLFGRKMKIGVKPLAGYSVVVRSPRYPRHTKDLDETGKLVDMAHSIFCSPGPHWTYSPEAVARMTASRKTQIYVARLNSDTKRLPDSASKIRGLMEESETKNLRKTTVMLAGSETGEALKEEDLEIVREGLCFRPVSESGIPIISRVYGLDTVQQDGGIMLQLDMDLGHHVIIRNWTYSC
jgi:glycine/D-amino acid oxidase-like deaminating enzyme